MKEERKERKIQKRKKQISRFPKKPEVLVRENALEKRRVSTIAEACPGSIGEMGVGVGVGGGEQRQLTEEQGKLDI